MILANGKCPICQEPGVEINLDTASLICSNKGCKHIITPPQPLAETHILRRVAEDIYARCISRNIPTHCINEPISISDSSLAQKKEPGKKAEQAQDAISYWPDWHKRLGEKYDKVAEDFDEGKCLNALIHDMPEPPCKRCKFWEPHVRIVKDFQFEIKMCYAEERYQDFSCYKKRG